MDKEKLHFFYNSKKFSDCTFKVHNVEVKAHKLILACKSPVFEKMFFGPMASNEVNISDVNYEEFNKVLKYIYIDAIDISSVPDAWNLFYIAKKYLLDDLMDICLCYVKKNLSLNTVVLSYEYSEMFNLTEIKNKCFVDMINYVRGVFSCDYHMKAETLRYLLENINTNYITSFELLTKIIDWATVTCELNNFEPNAKNIVSVLNKENLVRFIKKEWLLKLNCGDCLDPQLLCQCLDSVAQETVTLLDSTLDVNEEAKETVLNTFTPSFCKHRIAYKIAYRVDLQKNEVFVSSISVSRPVIIFGVLLKTQMNPSVCWKDHYNGSVSVTICNENSNKNIVVPTTYSGMIEYDSEIYIPLKHLVVLESDESYDLRISYTNFDNKLRVTPVHCYYMSQDLVNQNSVVTFYEMNGTLIKGLAFYPA